MNARINLETSIVSPGQEIRGIASWMASEPVREASVRLFWRTEGKGDGNSATVEVVRFDPPGMMDERSFTFAGPWLPWSCSGTLISVVWAVELVLEPGEAVLAEIIVSPTGKEIDLGSDQWLQMENPRRPLFKR